jgi:hypothetical protein
MIEVNPCRKDQMESPPRCARVRMFGLMQN